MTNYVWYPVTGDGSQASPYTWNAGTINFDTGADWAEATSLNIGSIPTSTGDVPGSGTGTSQGPGNDSVGLVAGDISSTLFSFYHPDPSHGDPYIAGSSFPVDVLLNSGSVELGGLLLAGFNVVPDVAQFPTLQVSGATLDITGDIVNSATVHFPTINAGFFGTYDSATASGGGTIDIQNVASVEVGGTVLSGIDMNFADTDGEKLQLDQPSASGSAFSGLITGMADGNAIILPNVVYELNGVITTGVYDSGTYTVTVNGSSGFAFNVSGLADADKLQVKALNGGIELVTCFAAGVRILTPAGEVAVESLAIGQSVMTASGEAKPIRWLGHRTIDLTRHSRPESVRPIRIAAGALAEGLPVRDLLVSPDHGMLVDGALIPARMLINHRSITEETGAASVTYFHVELDKHDIIFAEGAPSESYLDTGNRNVFDNAAVTVINPDLSVAQRLRMPAHGACMPLVTDSANVLPVWQRLAERAGTTADEVEAGLSPVGNGDIRLVVGSRTVRPVVEEADEVIFALPRDASQVRLVSAAARPNRTRPWLNDRRSLSFAVTDVFADQTAIPLDSFRWSDGDAVIAVPSGTKLLRIRLHARMLDGGRERQAEAA